MSMRAMDRGKRSDRTEIRVGDWVRERPAAHFQPCYCCLCRPPLGVRPAFRVEAIAGSRDERVLHLAGEGEAPADEYERVPGGDSQPPGAHGRHRAPQQVNLRALSGRDTLRQLLAAAL